MRPLTRTASLVLVVSATTFGALSATSAQDAGDYPMSQVRALTESWDARSGAQQREYFVRAGDLAGRLSEFDQGPAVSAALALLTDVIGKTSPSSGVTEASLEIVASDLAALEKIAQFLLSEGNLPYGLPTEKVTALSSLLGRVRQEFDPNFIQRPVVRKVSPPVGSTGIRMPGMSPSAIADPNDRRKYEDAIRANQANNIANERQLVLAQMESQFASRIVAVIRQASTSGKVPVEVIRQAASRARLTDEERVGIHM